MQSVNMLNKFNIGTLDIDIQLFWLIKSKELLRPVSFMLPFTVQLYGDFQNGAVRVLSCPETLNLELPLMSAITEFDRTV